VSSIQIGACPSRAAALARFEASCAVSAAPQPLCVHVPLRGEHAQQEGFSTHFQREDRRRNVAFDGRVLRDVQHEGRLAHGRTGRDDHEVRRLEAERHLVEVREPRRHAGEVAAARAQHLDALHRGPEQRLDLDEPLGAAAVVELEDLALGEVEQLGHVGRALVAFAHERGGRLDQPPPQRLLADDPAMVLHVRRGRDLVEEAAEIFLAAGAGEIPALLELVGEREGIHHRAGVVHGHHRTEQPAVALAVEHVLGHELGGGDDGIRRQDHRGEHGALRVLRPRRPAVAVDI
jgi:hypothetical protein